MLFVLLFSPKYVTKHFLSNQVRSLATLFSDGLINHSCLEDFGQSLLFRRLWSSWNLVKTLMLMLGSQLPQPTCSWKWHPDTCQLGNPTNARLNFWVLSMVKVLKLNLDKLKIWLYKIYFVDSNQPLGPLCLWQCFAQCPLAHCKTFFLDFGLNLRHVCSVGQN